METCKQKQQSLESLPAKIRIERRASTRVPAEGKVFLFADDADAQCIDGELLDVSDTGFRASHNCTALQSGQIVMFGHASATGRAQVMWNRVVKNGVESGFFILTRSA